MEEEESQISIPAPKRRKLERSDTTIMPSNVDEYMLTHQETNAASGGENENTTTPIGAFLASAPSFSFLSNAFHMPDDVAQGIIRWLDISTFGRLSLVDSHFQYQLWSRLTDFDDTRFFVLSRLLVAPHFQSLSFANLKYVSLSKSKFVVSDESLQLIGERLTNLKSLDLSWCHTITYHGFKHLTSLTKLESLSVRGCANLNCSAFQPAVGMLKSLKKLDISHCLKFDALYEEDMCKLTQLTHLEMERCPFMTNIAVVDSLMHFSHLKVLNLSGSILFTGFLLPVISRVCKSLEVLDISYCPAMSTPPESYESLRSLSSLRCLDVGGCSDDRGVVARRLLPHIRVFV